MSWETAVKVSFDASKKIHIFALSLLFQESREAQKAFIDDEKDYTKTLREKLR